MKLSLSLPSLASVVRPPTLRVTAQMLLFVGICLALQALFAFTLIPLDGSNATVFPSVAALSNFLPTLSLGLTFLISWSKPPARILSPPLAFLAHPLHTLAAYLLVPSLLLLGTGVFYAYFPDSSDIAMNARVAEAQRTRGLGVAAARSEAFYDLALTLLLAPLTSIVFAFGQELAWRAFFLDELCRYLHPALATWVVGLLWGLSYAPLVAVGAFYGTDYTGAPFTGVLSFCLFAVAFGNILAFFFLTTRSLLPCLLLHSAFLGLTDLSRFLGDPSLPPHVSALVGPAAPALLPSFFLLVFGLVLPFYLYFPATPDKLVDTTDPSESSEPNIPV